MLSEQAKTYSHKTIATVVGTTESTVKFWLKDFRDCLPYEQGEYRQRIMDSRFVNFLREVKHLRSKGVHGSELRAALLPRLAEFGFEPATVAVDAVLVEDEPEEVDLEMIEDKPEEGDLEMVEVSKSQALYVLQNLGDRLEQTLARVAEDRNLSVQISEVQRQLGVAETNAKHYQERYEDQCVRNLELREENQRLQERLAQLERHQSRGLMSRIFG